MNKVLVFDVLVEGSYKFQHGFEFCPLFPIDFATVTKDVVEKHPTLKGTKFNLDIVCSVAKDKYRKWKKYRKKCFD